MNPHDHIPAYCGIAKCKEEARYWIDIPKRTDDTLYLCDSHNEQIDPEGTGVYPHIEGNEIKFEEIGVYTCADVNEECPVCQ